MIKIHLQQLPNPPQNLLTLGRKPPLTRKVVHTPAAFMGKKFHDEAKNNSWVAVLNPQIKSVTNIVLISNNQVFFRNRALARFSLRRRELHDDMTMRKPS